MGRARAAHLGPELRRPLVLDAALPLFARDGYDAVSMQAIADAAGVSKPVLYSCFDSKEELFERAAAPRGAQVLAHGRGVGAGPRRAGRQRGLCCATAWRRCCARWSRRQTRFASSTCSATARTASSAGASTGSSGSARSLAAWTQLPERETTLLGRMLVALAELAFRVQLEEPDQWQPDALAAYLARVVIHGIPTG